MITFLTRYVPTLSSHLCYLARFPVAHRCFGERCHNRSTTIHSWNPSVTALSGAAVVSDSPPSDSQAGLLCGTSSFQSSGHVQESHDDDDARRGCACVLHADADGACTSSPSLTSPSPVGFVVSLLCVVPTIICHAAYLDGYRRMTWLTRHRVCRKTWTLKHSRISANGSLRSAKCRALSRAAILNPGECAIPP